MKVDVLLGLQWGDEGKGKIVDVLTPQYDIVARFQGGPNAGHTIEFDGKKYVLHNIPSGVFNADCVNVIGNGVIIDPYILMGESAGLKQSGIDITRNLVISKKAHLILPTHRALDFMNEQMAGKGRIGSTLKGIGPTYTDKIARKGLRVGDILGSNFMQKYETLKQSHLAQIRAFGFDPETTMPGDKSLSDYEAMWLGAVEQFKELNFIDSEYFINEQLGKGKNVLAEGAQGSMLDVDFGNYPFVTSSSVVSAGVCSGLGVAPSKIGRVYGIFKAYCTRVGEGPFYTELFDEVGDMLCQNGHEFGATTGRRRRCGWLDLAALKYCVMINGVTDLMMMKSDVMDGMPTVKVGVGYRVNGKVIENLPFEACTENLEPVYKEFKGWEHSCVDGKISKELEEYIRFVENYLGVPITCVSVGPDRTAVIYRNK